MSRSRRGGYTGSKRFGPCRNHGTCKWCVSNRTACDARRRLAASVDLQIFQEDTARRLPAEATESE